jgi:hypothetical protein
MGFFDSISVKVMRASPPEFAATAEFAGDAVTLATNGLPWRNAALAEAYVGFIVAALALTTDEIIGGWSADGRREVTRLLKLAAARLSDEQQAMARDQLHSINNVWNLNWADR